MEKKAKSKKPYIPTPIVFECEGYRSTHDGMERMITGDVETLFVQCVILVVHTSRLQYRLTTLQRAYGTSLYKARSSLGDTFEGKLEYLLVWAKGLPRCWIRCTRTKLTYHSMVRSTNYITLWHVALYEEKMQSACSTMTVEDLWRLWIISGRHSTQGVHRRNISAIRIELRARGFTVTPDSEMAITIHQV